MDQMASLQHTGQQEFEDRELAYVSERKQAQWEKQSQYLQQREVTHQKILEQEGPLMEDQLRDKVMLPMPCCAFGEQSKLPLQCL